MEQVLQRLWLAFIPLFVAFDVLGLLPVYWALAQDHPAAARQDSLNKAIIVAFFVALGFLAVSGWLFQLMGIEMSDVMMAGGIILFGLALNDLLRPEKISSSAESMGVVPLGVPLIVGPAVLTTLLLSRQRYGMSPTLAALSLNVLLTWGVLWAADRLLDRLGRETTRVISKVSSLVLAAFAVMLVRHGWTLLMAAKSASPS